jgi:pyruvate dehydrogenase E1 component beta subunit
VAEVKRTGTDITIVATSSMVQIALNAALMLEGIGISAEVVDPRTTWPLDTQTLIESAKKTSRVIVVDGRHGVTPEIVAVIAEGAFYHLAAPIQRIGVMNLFSPALGDLMMPSARMVFEAARALCQPSERFLTVARERRKIAWFQRRIALTGGRRSALTGDEP